MTSISERLNNFRAFVGRSIAYPVILLLILSAVLGWRILALVSASKSEAKSDAVIGQAEYTLNLAVDAETGSRGYLVDKNPIFLERYYIAQQSIGTAFAHLRSDVQEQGLSPSVVDNLQSRYFAWLNEAKIEVNLANTSPNTYRAYFDLANGKRLMDSLREGFADFLTLEQQEKESRTKAVETSTYVTLVICVALAVSLGCLIGMISVYQLRQFVGLYETALVETQTNEQLLSATLLGIGDAVLVTDEMGRVTMLNAICEELTGWTIREARGRDAKEIFNIVNESTRAIVDSPIDRVIKEGVTVGLANHTLLIRRDGTEIPIDDSGAPIRNERGRLIGVVLVFRDISERKQTEDELARIYEREHRIAENLQRSLLTKPDPSLYPALEVETFYQPAWLEAQVGGDYYDIFLLDDGRVVMVVGDVSGKGLRAASRTAEMKYTLRAYLRENGDGADAASRLNRFVNNLMPGDDLQSFFLCLTIAILDPSTCEGLVTVCGAEAPIIIRQDGSVDELKIGGAPIGVLSEGEFSSELFNLAQGELLLVATDGITEARKGGEFLYTEGLGRLAVRADKSKTVKEIGDEIVAGVKEYSDGALRDDICLLICRAIRS